jgi:NAD(P)-dependent dehydrogenase (short-subunit alcohol dehydrogenase family)
MTESGHGRVEGKVAIVTGGGSGIGAATSKLLASEGAAVCVADLIGERAQQVADEIVAAGGRAIGVAADVSIEADVIAMVAAAVEAFGGLDVLHNNAALTDPDLFAPDQRITEMPVDTWDLTMAVNVRGPMLGCKHAIPRMIERGGGSIVNMSSTSSRLGDHTRTAYGVSKAAVNTLTNYVATQYGLDGIRCNTISPGPILTPALRNNIPPDVANVIQRNVLTPRLGEPDDIAHLVLYFASDESAYVTGQYIGCNGGLDAHQPHLGERIDAVRAEQLALRDDA